MLSKQIKNANDINIIENKICKSPKNKKDSKPEKYQKSITSKY